MRELVVIIYYENATRIGRDINNKGDIIEGNCRRLKAGLFYKLKSAKAVGRKNTTKNKI